MKKWIIAAAAVLLAWNLFLTVSYSNLKAKIENGVIGKNLKFSRIRRITGYLVGDISKWNNAKRAEEHDRVKHSY